MTITERHEHEEELLHDHGGQGLVEYAIIIALIAVVCLIGVRGAGEGTRLHSHSPVSSAGSGR